MDIKKVYIDTRFKTSDSNSDSDFYVELPRAMNIPDKCVCYIDDVVIPVSWTMIDERNNMLYLGIRINGVLSRETVIFDSGNYNGVSFAPVFESKVNAALLSHDLSVTVTYDFMNNKLRTVLRDDRSMVIGDATIAFLSNSELVFAGSNPNVLSSLNGVLMISGSSVTLLPGIAFDTYLDLHTTRNLYLTSSSLGSYNTISNFGSDVIIKKIPVRYNYNEMLFDSSETGYDYLDVSKRMLRRIDFRLQDSFGNIINLNKNHWSFSLIFQLQD
jgi:hypothetical protein